MRYILYWMILVLAGSIVILAQDAPPEPPKISEIIQFCQETEQMLQGNTEKTPASPSTPTIQSAELMRKWKSRVIQEQKVLENYALQIKDKRRWLKDDRAYLDLLVTLGLYDQAKVWAQDQIVRSTPWADCGNAHLQLALLYQQSGEFTRVEAPLAKAEAMHDDFWIKKRPPTSKKPVDHRLRDEWKRYKERWHNKQDVWQKKYEEYLQAGQDLLAKPDEFESWRRWIALGADLEYHPEILASYALWMESGPKNLEPKDRILALLAYSRECMHVHQPDRSLKVIAKLESEKLVLSEEENAEIVHLKARAYAELRQREEAIRWMTKLKQQFPQYVKTRLWAIEQLEKEIAND